MRGNRVSVILSMAVVALSCLPAARAEGGDKSGSTASLSEVNFPISCGAAAQKGQDNGNAISSHRDLPESRLESGTSTERRHLNIASCRGQCELVHTCLSLGNKLEFSRCLP